MADPIALCIEDLAAVDRASRFVRCVALVGRQPGLRIGPAGETDWKSEAAVACELWASADDRLIAYRPEAAPPVTVDRAGRTLEIPESKPVVLLDQDLLLVADRRLRIHVHGTAVAAAPPSPLPIRAGGGAARMAAVMAVGAAVIGCDRPIEVRDTPPQMVEPPDTTPPGTTSAAAPFASPPPATAAPTSPPPVAATSQPTSPPPIEVRDAPPEAPE